MSKKFLVGSTYFFSQYPDFKGKDTDIVVIERSDAPFDFRQESKNNKCIFTLRYRKTAQDYIDYALQQKAVPMVVGKFLIPEFCEFINLTIADLKQLQPLIDNLDKKHQYEAIIYNSYLKNKAFMLTESQRKQAYQSYKQSRQL